MANRNLIRQSQTHELAPLVNAITSCLRTLNPRNDSSSQINTAPLDKFSPHLDPNLVTEVINKQTNPHHALFFFNWASNPNPNPNNYSHTHRCYVAITDLLLSRSLFSTASSLIQEPNKFADLVVSKFIAYHGSRGNVKGAIYWFHKVKEVEKGKCLFSCNALLGVLVKASLINLAKSFFDQIVNDGAVKLEASTYTTMIRGFCKVGMVKDARKVFDEMTCEPNVVTYNTLISGYCKKGDMENAMMLFHQIASSQSYGPDEVTYTTVIDGFCKKGEFDEAMKWMDQMADPGLKPNLKTYNAVIYALCLKGNVDQAKMLLTKMRLNGLRENVATHMSILKGLCVARKSDEAVNYFKEMDRKGMIVDAKVYGTIVNEYCRMRKADEAISFLREMQAKRISPHVSSFNAVFRILLELGELDRAVFLLKQMRNMGCTPNFLSYSIVVCSLCKSKGRMQEVEILVNEMLQNGFYIDADMYSCLVKGYCEAGNEEMATKVFLESVEKRYIITAESFSSLVYQLCEKGKEEEAEKIFENMSRRCPVLDLNSYRRVLDGAIMHTSAERSKGSQYIE